MNMSSLDLGRLGQSGDWRCKIERDFTRAQIKVWLFHRYGDHFEFLRSDNMMIGLEHGEALPETPTFVFPESAFEALMAAGADILPPSAAVDRHLQDALVVRDRLLDLVERSVV